MLILDEFCSFSSLVSRRGRWYEPLNTVLSTFVDRSFLLRQTHRVLRQDRATWRRIQRMKRVAQHNSFIASYDVPVFVSVKLRIVIN